MAYQHKKQAGGEWSKSSFFSQMANIGSEVGRAINWRRKENKAYARGAFERSLELFDLTAADPRNIGRLKEILRAREAWVDFFAYDNEYNSTAGQWEKYFLAFNYAANLNR
ncbi:MAG: hypothetical protein WC745_02940 [Patescibacteria group bacterium]|jgi:hypothetical protein